MSKLPGLPGPAEPIQLDLHAIMNGIAQGLDDVFNGPGCEPADKRVWFFLAAGNFAAGTPLPETGRFNYISNADKLDVRGILRDVLARLDARAAEEGKL